MTVITQTITVVPKEVADRFAIVKALLTPGINDFISQSPSVSTSVLSWCFKCLDIQRKNIVKSMSQTMLEFYSHNTPKGLPAYKDRLHKQVDRLAGAIANDVGIYKDFVDYWSTSFGVESIDYDLV